MSLQKTYQPSGNKYTYMGDIAKVSLSYNGLEQKALESHGYDTSYPSTYCNTIVYGGVEMAIDSVMTTDPRSSIAQFMSPDEYSSASVQLAKPVYALFNGSTQLYQNMPFGQDAGETVPAKLVVTYPGAGGTTFTWYKNGSVVATDTINNATTSICIAVIYSGNTIQNYAYVYMYNNEVWTSGVKGTSEVIEILNAGGYAGSDENKFGFTDEQFGDFAFSRIFDADGHDATSGMASKFVVGSDIPYANADLQSRCDMYGGYLGTDFISYATGMTNGSGWSYLKNNSDSDGLSVTLPSTDEHEYTFKWNFSQKLFNLYIDGVIDPNAVNLGSNYMQDGSYIYFTWYKQSKSIEMASNLITVYLVTASPEPYYTLRSINDVPIADLDVQEFDNSEDFSNYVDGYDPHYGEEDDEQEDPDDIDDPVYDPLASGFLYAFMVSQSDMEHFAECLIPDTLVQKIKSDFGNNLFDFIVSYHMMPCLTNGSSLTTKNILYRGQPFVYGDNDTQLALSPITKTWYTVSCGSKICLPASTEAHPLRNKGYENWADASVQIYLPFIGYQHLNTADVWGKEISVTYKFDILQGTCVANIGVSGQGTLYSFEGSCKYTIPFTSAIDRSNSELLSGIFSSINAGVNLGGAIAGGSPAGIIGSAGSIADATGHFLSAINHKSIINRSGTLSGSPGWLMPRSPALIITVPDIIKMGDGYNSTNGYPCCVETTLNGYEGFYVECGKIDLQCRANVNGAMPNDTEIDLITSLLKEGVYV